MLRKLFLALGYFFVTTRLFGQELPSIAPPAAINLEQDPEALPKVIKDGYFLKDGRWFPVELLNPAPEANNAVSSLDSPRQQMELLYLSCPSLTTGFIELKQNSNFDWRLSKPQFEKLSAAIEQAVKERQELLKLSEESKTEVWKNEKLLTKFFTSDRNAERRISDIFEELVIPQDAPYYFSKMENRIVVALAVSRYFTGEMGIHQSTFQRRETVLRELYKAEAEYIVTPTERVLKARTQLTHAIFSDVSSKEFLRLHVLVGRANASDSVSTYMRRLREDEAKMVLTFFPAIKADISASNR